MCVCLLVSFLIMQSVTSGTVGFSYKGRGLRAPFAQSCCVYKLPHKLFALSFLLRAAKAGWSCCFLLKVVLKSIFRQLMRNPSSQTKSCRNTSVSITLSLALCPYVSACSVSLCSMQCVTVVCLSICVVSLSICVVCLCMCVVCHSCKTCMFEYLCSVSL